MGTVKLRRRLFGFSSQDVHQVLAERDFATGQVQERAAGAEEMLRKLDAELAPARQELTQKAEEIASLRAQVSELRQEIHEIRKQTAEHPAPAGSDPIMGLLMSEIAPIVEAARVSAATMIEQARKSSEHQAEEAEETRELLRRQARSMSSWWNGVHGLIDPITSSLERSKAQIEQIPARVQDALSPLAELMTAVSAQLADLARMAEPPSFEPTHEAQPVVVDLTSAESETANQDPQDEAAHTTAGAEQERANPPWRPVSWWPYAGSPGGRSAAS